VVTISARFDRWLAALEARHRRHLTTRELGRAVRALSTRYVERRDTLASGAALSSAGKRAAFALYYAPLHWMAVSSIARSLPRLAHRPRTIVDLGCGTGASGAAWADAFQDPPALMGFDRSAWAVKEAAWTYRIAGLEGFACRADAARVALPRPGGAILAAFTVNELQPSTRQALLQRVVPARPHGAAVLIVEPISRKLTPWWDEWRQRFEAAGGRADEWRFQLELPGPVETIGRAAGLDTREITARSLFLAGDGR
jgi:hypothetical protein